MPVHFSNGSLQYRYFVLFSKLSNLMMSVSRDIVNNPVNVVTSTLLHCLFPIDFYHFYSILSWRFLNKFYYLFCWHFLWCYTTDDCVQKGALIQSWNNELIGIVVIQWKRFARDVKYQTIVTLIKPSTEKWASLYAITIS